MKIIKLSDTHYIICDNSEIKEGDKFIIECTINTNNFSILTANKSDEKVKDGRLKVIHSTQSLEDSFIKNNEFGVTDYGAKDNYHTHSKVFDKIKPLSLSEVEEAINGYSVEEMSEKSNGYGVYGKGLPNYNAFNDGYIAGFKAHRELVKDKFILTKAQLFKIIAMSKIAKTHDGLIDMDSWINNGYEGDTPAYTEEEIIESLLPKTEWDIEFDEQGKIKVI